MIYLRTGANGTGKTLLTLKDVREKQIAEARPVYHNGRFKLTGEGEKFGWQQIEFKDWQTVPDGAIFIIDECHNDMPVRGGKEPPPDWIRMLAEHRRRGFDFYLITQHPMNIDAFVRRLIGSPGWHQHLKRQSGAPLVSRTEWNVVNEQPQRPGASESGQLQMVSYPREVYQWYESATLHTAKTKIPFQVKLLIAMLFVIPALGYFGWQSFNKAIPKGPAQETAQATAQAQTPPAHRNNAAGTSAPAAQTPAQYIASFEPRIAGLPHTAPRYEAQTAPAVAPFPAACVNMGTRCQCYTQQATKLDVPPDLCKQIVKNGYFMDWQEGKPSGAQPLAPPTS